MASHTNGEWDDGIVKEELKEEMDDTDNEDEISEEEWNVRNMSETMEEQPKSQNKRPKRPVTPRRREKERERSRRVRARAKAEANPEKLAKERERARLRRARKNAEDPEFKVRERERKRLARARQMANETEEERQARLGKRRKPSVARNASGSEAAGKKESGGNRRGEKGSEQRRKFNEGRREKERFHNMLRRLNMSEEKKAQVRQQQYLYNMANRERNSWANLPPEEVERRKQRQRNWKASLTGEKKERHRQSVLRSVRKQQKKMYENRKVDPDKFREFRQRVYEYQKKRIANETPEQRQRRLRKDRVNLAKGKLRKKLREEEVPEEEIERQVLELAECMWREFYPNGDVPPPWEGKKGPPRKNAGPIPEKTKALPVQVCSDPATSFDILIPGVTVVFDNTDFPVPEDWSPLGTPVPSPPCSPPPDTLLLKEETGTLHDSGVVALACGHCSAQFYEDLPLRSHIITSHSEKCCKCPKCKEVMLSPQELCQHYASSHKNTPSPDKTPSTKTSPHVGEKMNLPKTFVCIKCPAGRAERFRNREELFSHVRTEHPFHFWPCPDCNLLKYSERSLALHRSVCRFANKM